MCGFAGVLHLDGRPADPGVLARMGRWLRHRGPDGEGLHVDGPLGICHRRLAVIDLSDAARQPMRHPARNLVIAYNGECFNAPALREELRARGHAFSSTSDTEVVLAGFCEWGPDVVSRMVGMFAFAVWDGAKRELHLFRDRLGIKPLYLHLGEGHLLFGSEIKPLLEAGAPAAVDREALAEYLTLRHVAGRQTLFAGIRTLGPGRHLAADRDGRVLDQAYWTLPPGPVEADRRGREEAPDRYFEALGEAVRGAMLSDVPVGAFFSGGIDSSAVVALMRRERPDLDTFTFRMPGDLDETACAAEVARALGLRHHVTEWRPDDFARFEQAVYHLEEPLGDAIIAPTLRLAADAARRVKVVLCGEGADETLAGYVHHLVLHHAEGVRRRLGSWSSPLVSAALRAAPLGLLDVAFPYPARLSRRGVDRLRSCIGALDRPASAYRALVGLFSADELSGLLRPDFLDPVAASASVDRALDAAWPGGGPRLLDQLIRFDLAIWTPNYTLLRLDKLTMSSSLEARVPFLDHRLVELCLRLPASEHVRGLERKRLLRRAFASRGLLPESVRRAPKRPFYLPIERTFDEGFRELVEELLGEAAVRRRGFFDPCAVRAIAGDPRPDLVRRKQLVVLLVLELWARLYLDGGWRRGPPG